MGDKISESVGTRVVIKHRGHYVSMCKECNQKFYRRSDSNTEFCNWGCRTKYQHRLREINCEICNKIFLPRDNQSKYCSYKCSGIAIRKDNNVNCNKCGKGIKRSPTEIRENNFCSRDCFYTYIRENPNSRTKHHNWKGGVSISGGYRFILQDDDSYKLEHRIIIEKYLGRGLGSGEIVHHIDGDKLNNDISNLQLVTREEHMAIHRERGDLYL